MKVLFIFFSSIFIFSCGDGLKGPSSSNVSSSENQKLVPEKSLSKNLKNFPIEFKALEFDSENQMPTDMLFIPGTNQALVSYHDGSIGYYKLTTKGFLKIKKFRVSEVFQEGECGLNSIAFESTGFIYLGYCSNKHTRRVSRFLWNQSIADDETIFPEIVFEDYEEEPNGSIHTIGDLIFDKDNLLYIFLGDMGFHDIASNDFRPGAKDISAGNNKGKILRIRPLPIGQAQKYSIVSENPFSGDASKNENIFAYGLRNPWKGFLDSSNRLWIGDVGGGKYEELNIASPTGGEYFGYQEWEGPCQKDCDGITAPALSYLHDFNHRYRFEDPLTLPRPGWAIWVGIEYNPTTTDRYNSLLDNFVLYGDLFRGWVRAARVNENLQLEKDIAIANIGEKSPASWNQGPDDFIYVITLDGSFFRAELSSPAYN